MHYMASQFRIEIHRAGPQMPGTRGPRSSTEKTEYFPNFQLTSIISSMRNSMQIDRNDTEPYLFLPYWGACTGLIKVYRQTSYLSWFPSFRNESIKLAETGIVYIGTGNSQNGYIKKQLRRVWEVSEKYQQLCRSDNFHSFLSFSLFYFRVFC